MTRHEARENAFLLIFEKSFLDEAPDELFLMAEEYCDIKVNNYTKEVVTTLFDNLDVIDSAIDANLKNWNRNRISKVSDALLRLSVCEMMFSFAPVSVSINEAVELAKAYGAEDDYTFVNGVLGSIAKSLPEEIQNG